VRSRRHVLRACVILALPLGTKIAWACSRVYSTVKVKTVFVIFVHDPRGKPLADMKITAYEFIRKPPYPELAATAITGKDGKAAIGLTQDDYSIGAMHSDVSSEIAQIAVYDDGSGASEISLTWPGGPITEIQNVSGVFGLGKDKDLWVGAEITLKDSASKKHIAEGESDSQGRFKFPSVPPGFYAWHVRAKIPNPGRLPQLEGDVAIRVSSSAENFELPTLGLRGEQLRIGGLQGRTIHDYFQPLRLEES